MPTITSPLKQPRKQTHRLSATATLNTDSASWVAAAAAAAKLLQSCLTLCDPIDGSPPGSPIPGILRARVLEWVAISFSNAWKWKVKVKSFSCVQPVATPSTAAYQAPLSMGFSRQEYWSGLPLPSPQKVLEQFYSDCFDPVEQFRRARHLNSIDSSSPWAWYSSPFI